MVKTDVEVLLNHYTLTQLTPALYPCHSLIVILVCRFTLRMHTDLFIVLMDIRSQLIVLTLNKSSNNLQQTGHFPDELCRALAQ